MKYLRFLFLAPLLLAFQCESDEIEVADNLDTTGLFGSWEIQDEIINGNISDMIPKCCEFLRFDKDGDVSDNIGLLTYTDSQGLVNDGIFEVDLDNQTILIIYDDNDTFMFDFSVNNAQEILTIDFSENGTNYTQTWIRIQ